MPLITPQYAQQLEQVHNTRSWGDIGHRHKQQILAVYAQHGCNSILDYGCGAGRLSKCLEPLVVQNYDPGVSKYAQQPQPADLVVCTDVLEHVEPECVDDVLAHLHSCTLAVAYITICGIPAKGALPDGRNLHLVQQQHNWWWPRLQAAGFSMIDCDHKQMHYTLRA